MTTVASEPHCCLYWHKRTHTHTHTHANSYLFIYTKTYIHVCTIYIYKSYIYISDSWEVEEEIEAIECSLWPTILRNCTRPCQSFRVSGGSDEQNRWRYINDRMRMRMRIRMANEPGIQFIFILFRVVMPLCIDQEETQGLCLGLKLSNLFITANAICWQSFEIEARPHKYFQYQYPVSLICLSVLGFDHKQRLLKEKQMITY